MRTKRWLLGVLVLLLGWTVSACADPTIVRIGATSASQEQILAWMMQELCERKGIDAEVKTVTGGMENLQPPLESGSLQVGIEFAQNAWQTVLKEKETYQAQDLTILQRKYADKQLEWIALPMVKDHYTLAVRKDLARQYNLSKLSDLVEIAGDLRLGGPTSFFSTEDGFPWLASVYGFDFGTIVNLPEDGMIDALRNQSADVVPVRALDGRVQKSSIVVLEDDLSAYEDSTAGIVISKAALLEDPSLAELARSIGGVITAEQLSFYAGLVSENTCTAQQAALVLLTNAGLITEKPES